MKKLLSILIVMFLVIPTGFTFGSNNNNVVTAVTVNKIGIRGVVKDINLGKDGANLLVEGKVQEDTIYAKATVHIDIHTKITKDKSGTTYKISDIKLGDTIEVNFTGAVDKSDPVWGTAQNINIVSDSVNASDSANKIGIRGVVKNINSGKDGANILVEGSKTEDTMYDKATVHIDIHTIITKDNLKRLYSASDIKVGDTVEVAFNGSVMESYPVQGTAKSVRMITVTSNNSKTYALTNAYLSLSVADRKTVIDYKKATVEAFTAPDKYTVSYKGTMRNIEGKQTIIVTFNTTNSKLLGPIVVYLDKNSLVVLGYGLRR